MSGKTGNRVRLALTRAGRFVPGDAVRDTLHRCGRLGD